VGAIKRCDRRSLEPSREIADYAAREEVANELAAKPEKEEQLDAEVRAHPRSVDLWRVSILLASAALLACCIPAG
jgi:hypothetical protein